MTSNELFIPKSTRNMKNVQTFMGIYLKTSMFILFELYQLLMNVCLDMNIFASNKLYSQQ